MALMTKESLLAICKEHDLYKTPSLNDKLYLNFKGFTNIANLEAYTGLRALFLEGNALDSLEGLPELKELRCLYVQQNSISSITGLERLEALDTLNISQNHISKLENLACCPTLRTLICTHNKLESLESVAHVSQCTGLHTLDLQNNNIKDPAILDLLKPLTNLKCLYLKGNPVVSMMKNYRKTIVANLPSLTYLDDRPVFEDERRIVNAWVRGGLDAERAERQAIKDEEEARNRVNFEAMQQIRKDGWRKRRERQGLAAGDTDPALDELSDDDYVFQEEPAELVAARAQLAGFTAQAGIEEPPELTEARRGLVQSGKALQEGWDNTQSAQRDAQAYLDSVKQSQAELDILVKGAARRGADDTMDQAMSMVQVQQPAVVDVDLTELD